MHGGSHLSKGQFVVTAQYRDIRQSAANNCDGVHNTQRYIRCYLYLHRRPLDLGAVESGERPQYVDLASYAAVIPDNQSNLRGV